MLICWLPGRCVVRRHGQAACSIARKERYWESPQPIDRHRSFLRYLEAERAALGQPTLQLGNPGRHLFGCKRIVISHHSFALQPSKIENCIVIFIAYTGFGNLHTDLQAQRPACLICEYVTNSGFHGFVYAQHADGASRAWRLVGLCAWA